MFKEIRNYFSFKSRLQRGKIFKNYLNPKEKDKILDLGSGNGSHLAGIINYRKNVFCADISQSSLIKCKKLGFKTILLKQSAKLPFPNKYWDIVFCSSVIEHISGDKNKLERYGSNTEFDKQAWNNQYLFAQEIKRIAKKYFVQTPNKYFPIESHTLLPFIIIYIPYRLKLIFIKIISKLFFWPLAVKYRPDWHLLTKKQVKELFPDCVIIEEKFLWFTKSFMIIKN